MPQNSATRVSGALRGVRAGLGATYPTLHNFVAQLVLQIRALVLGSAAQRVQGVDDLLLSNVDSAGPSHTGERLQPSSTCGCCVLVAGSCAPPSQL